MCENLEKGLYKGKDDEFSDGHTHLEVTAENLVH